ncbi:hypothetical protein BU15DRAFT_80018 [Melanogaster broomeanus]|nr:hypothetical protein BU15DRAFT_80018 [Melanogaster broomeanus]
MPLITTVVDDKSPLILYDASWFPGTSADPLADQYYLGTFTSNNVTDGKATFSFNGTAVWIYGAKRENHGTYTIELDSASYPNNNGYSANSLFQQSLFNMSGLTQGMHTMNLINTATSSTNMYVGIDLIVWQSEVGNAGDQLSAELVQDTDPRFQYQVPAWGTTSSSVNFNFFSNGTGHSTQTYGASATFTFTPGDAVTLFGPTGPSNGPYAVQLDGGEIMTYNGSTFLTNYGVTLYHADNLGPGQHQMVLTNMPSTNGQSLSIDYAKLWNLSSGSSPNTSSSSGSPNTLSSGAIVGIVIPAVAAVLAAGAAFFFYRRWKAAVATQSDLYRVYTPQRNQETAIATTVATTFSSSQALSRRSHQQLDDQYQGAQYHGRTGITSDESESLMENVGMIGPPTESSVDEGLNRRPLPEAPGGGLSLSAEIPKLARSHRRESLQTANRHSGSTLPPPDYTQATQRG